MRLKLQLFATLTFLLTASQLHAKTPFSFQRVFQSKTIQVTAGALLSLGSMGNFVYLNTVKNSRRRAFQKDTSAINCEYASNNNDTRVQNVQECEVYKGEIANLRGTTIINTFLAGFSAFPGTLSLLGLISSKSDHQLLTARICGGVAIPLYLANAIWVQLCNDNAQAIDFPKGLEGNRIENLHYDYQNLVHVSSILSWSLFGTFTAYYLGWTTAFNLYNRQRSADLLNRNPVFNG